MKKSILACMFFIGCFALLARQKPSIIPVPRVYESQNSTFLLDNNVTIDYDDQLLADEAHFLQEQIFEKKALPLSIGKDLQERKISLVLTGEEIKSEAYHLNMNGGSIAIKSATEEGIFNGIVSLLQLIEFASSDSIPCWNIKDYPKHEWRGVMLDESRHFFGKEKVKSLLDWMAFYKLNRFHWHLTDDPGWRIEIKKYPLLTYIGGIGNDTDPDAAPKYYTREDIKEIVTYAAEKKITVIPEVDMPGHARAANRAYPQFSGGGSERHPNFTFDPGQEETYQYLTNILKEVDVLFPSQMIHLGGDEVHFGNQQWNENKGVQRLMKENDFTDLVEVEKHFMVRMADSLYAMGNKLLAWDEMADIALPTDQTIIFWWRHDQPEYLTKALDRNYQVVLCPRIPLYFDFVQHDIHQVGRRWAGAYSELQGVYTFNPEQYTKEKTSQVLGIQANLWTEVIQTEQRFDFMMFPRISALSEAAWGTNTDFSDYEDRLSDHLLLYEKSGIYFFNLFSPEEVSEPLK